MTETPNGNPAVDTDATTNPPGPHAEPTRDTDDDERVRTVAWNVGPMDGEWQPQAELRVAYLPHHGYCAHLRARRLCTGPHYTQYDYIDVHGDLIYSRPAQRYRNDAMDSFQRTALAELRALYDLGNAVVTLYFTPHRPTTTNDG